MDFSEFRGYPLPVSNTVYTPNQFWDVVIRYHSRGVVRLVGYMIRHTHGWCDRQGKPRYPNAEVTYSELIEDAGVSRGALRKALDDAIAAKFIECVRQPRAASLGDSGCSGIYRLKYDRSGNYTTDPKRFLGFFAGNGNLTYIPNAFFDHTLKTETLGVIKVVGAIARHTIGFQTDYGFRRQEIALSYNDLLNFTRLESTSTLSTAIKASLEHNHIVRIKAGYFDKKGGGDSTAAIYGLKWVEEEQSGSIIEAENRSKNRSGEGSSKIEAVEQSKNRSGCGPKSAVSHRSNNRSHIEITPQKNNEKEQRQITELPVVVLLLDLGFDQQTAQLLADSYNHEVIHNQIRWFPYRPKPQHPLGMLRASIEKNWCKPEGFEEAEQKRLANLAKVEEEKRVRHRQQYTNTWKTYVWTQFQTIESLHPELVYQFEEFEEDMLTNKVRDIEDPNGFGFANMVKRKFQTEDARLERIVEFFKDRILDFWEWDLKLNPER